MRVRDRRHVTSGRFFLFMQAFDGVEGTMDLAEIGLDWTGQGRAGQGMGLFTRFRPTGGKGAGGHVCGCFVCGPFFSPCFVFLVFLLGLGNGMGIA